MKILKCLFGLSCLTSPLMAYDARPPCYKDLERNFFHYDTVGQALSMNGVDQGQWGKIIQALQGRQSAAEQIIKDRAKALYPNPLEHPFQPDVARQLLLETMYQIFERVIIENGYFDPNAIRIMFDFIVTQNVNLTNCVPPQKR